MDIERVELLQSLWAGQGEIVRMTLASEAGGDLTLIAKHVTYSSTASHPRGWNSNNSDARKRRSYEVERQWYESVSPRALGELKIPKLIFSQSSEHGLLLVMEDLTPEYPGRFTAGKDDRPSANEICSCIRWLAMCHAQFLDAEPQGLWQSGGYWHLDTRPDEWESMPEGELKQHAAKWDALLKSSPYQTLIHGDAKLANFCFSSRGDKVAAVDFQYAGQGPGVKDLMLLLSSVMPDEALITEAEFFVNYYFEHLSNALGTYQPNVDAIEVIEAWKPLYAVAWADFHRFLVGWSPGHWKIGEYCKQQTSDALRLRA